MTVRELAEKLNLEVLSSAEPEREITGAYAGDLLSWVMGRAQSGDAWITIMTNINTVAVASLADVACVILAEDCEIEDDVVATAQAKGINLLRGGETTYQLCAALSQLI